MFPLFIGGTGIGFDSMPRAGTTRFRAMVTLLEHGFGLFFRRG